MRNAARPLRLQPCSRRPCTAFGKSFGKSFRREQARPARGRRSCSAVARRWRHPLRARTSFVVRRAHSFGAFAGCALYGCVLMTKLPEPSSEERGRVFPLGGEDFFEMLLDNACVAGLDGYFKRVNPAWTRTLGWTAEELLSR